MSEPLASLKQGRLRFLPVVPGAMEFAAEVRRALLAERPQVVAVELPSTLADAFLKAVERLPELSVILYPAGTKVAGMPGTLGTDEEEMVYIPVEITDPFVEAIRTAQEIGAEVFFIDPDVGQRPHLPGRYPDHYAVYRIGYDRYVAAYRELPPPATPEVIRHASGIAWKLQSCDPLAEIAVVVSLNLLDPVMAAMELPQEEPVSQRRHGVQLSNLHPDCLAEILEEFPFLQSVYEARRYGVPDGAGPSVEAVDQADKVDEAAELDAVFHRTAVHVSVPLGDVGADEPTPESAFQIPTPPERFRFMDRQRLNLRLFVEAERRYEKNTREKLAHWQRRAYARYSRNLALAGGGLIAGLFDQLVAARSIVDDNLAWELWALGSVHQRQRVESDIETVNIAGEEMFRHMRRIRLRRRLPRAKARLRPTGLRERKKEKTPGEWEREFRGHGICSYPPEDIVVENYGLFLRKKGKSILSEERVRTEPFTTSLRDGIDIRETLRNWTDGRLYVREFQKVSGEVGAVVVIFDEDREDHFGYHMTWQGEHSQESDMAFYATSPYEHVVGPGILRAEYGGFLMSYPPRRLVDVWHDIDYLFAEAKSETLLLAALDYSLERFIVYVAAKPPRSIFRTIAARRDRKIVYIPIGQLSPITIKKIRVLHILDGHDRREAAKDYIW